jgi:hypothetical protein
VWGERVEGSGPDLFWFFFREEAARVEVIEVSGVFFFFSVDHARGDMISCRLKRSDHNTWIFLVVETRVPKKPNKI